MKSNSLLVYDKISNLKKLFIEDRKCPICGNGNLQTKGLFFDSISCSNECIDIYLMSKFVITGNVLGSTRICVISIFKENIEMTSDNSEMEQEAIEKVQEMIDYWKEDNRYLVKFLSK